MQPAVNDPAAPRREEAAVPPDGDLGFGRGWCAADVAGGAAAVEPATVPGAVAGVWGQGQVGVETGAAHRRTSLSFGGYQNARPPWDGAGSQGKVNLVDPSRVLPRPVSSSSPARPAAEIVPSAALLCRPPRMPKLVAGVWGEVGLETGLEIDECSKASSPRLSERVGPGTGIPIPTAGPTTPGGLRVSGRLTSPVCEEWLRTHIALGSRRS